MQDLPTDMTWDFRYLMLSCQSFIGEHQKKGARWYAYMCISQDRKDVEQSQTIHISLLSHIQFDRAGVRPH
jgi:hypothetical protein